MLDEFIVDENLAEQVSVGHIDAALAICGLFLTVSRCVLVN